MLPVLICSLCELSQPQPITPSDCSLPAKRNAEMHKASPQLGFQPGGRETGAHRRDGPKKPGWGQGKDQPRGQLSSLRVWNSASAAWSRGQGCQPGVPLRSSAVSLSPVAHVIAVRARPCPCCIVLLIATCVCPPGPSRKAEPL